MTEDEIFEIEEAERLKYESDLHLAIEFVSKMADYANRRRNLAPFIQAFKSEHRALQQGMFSMMLKVMEALAEDDYPTDLRNEECKAVAKKLLVGFKEVKRQDYINEGCSPSRADEYVSGEFSKPSNYLSGI